MTQIVVLPNLLPELVQKASAHAPKHIRMFCQIINYDANTFNLTVGKIPMLANIDTKSVDVNVKGLFQTQISALNFDVGSIIEIDGFYNGKSIEPLSISELNWLDVTLEKLQVLEYMCEMKVM